MSVFFTGGPVRVVTDEPAPEDWQPAPLLGFTSPQSEPTEEVDPT